LFFVPNKRGVLSRFADYCVIQRRTSHVEAVKPHYLVVPRVLPASGMAGNIITPKGSARLDLRLADRFRGLRARVVASVACGNPSLLVAARIAGKAAITG